MPGPSDGTTEFSLVLASFNRMAETIAATQASLLDKNLKLAEAYRMQGKFISVVPGLTYDLLFVSPSSLSRHRADWLKVIEVYRDSVDVTPYFDSSLVKQIVAR
jgi:hypothetical protein